MYGVPFASPNLCGFYRGSDFTQDEEYLCVRSFQLAVVSPFAVYNTNGTDMNRLSVFSQRAIANNLEARMALLMYQRTELYKISKYGGALVRPLFTEYPYVKAFTPDMVDTVMYGDSLNVDFVFDPEALQKVVYLPPYSIWLDIFTGDRIAPTVEGGNNVTLEVYPTHPIIL